MNPRIDVKPSPVPSEDIMTEEALAFVALLHHEFEPRRQALIEARHARQRLWDAGQLPDFLPETAAVRQADWQVAPPPADLLKRRVEITGPVDRKMMINAFNSGANVFMADLEDSMSPTWTNVVQGQRNLKDAVRRNLEFTNPDGRVYRLNDQISVLLVRPRGWHLTESRVTVDGAPVSASVFDFGMYLFHNASALAERGTGPYYYLPKMESHLEARLWNDVFVFAQNSLGIPQGTIRATVLIETLLAAFEMDEILYELRDHIVGLNAGRWDYIFSLIKKLGKRPDCILPDRVQVTMAVPFMRAYTRLMIETCHKRGAHAIGGMAAFIPSRRDVKINETAFAKVREDKQREAGDGCDGTWVAHPDLVPVAMEVFDAIVGDEPHQKDKPAVSGVTGRDLVTMDVAGGAVTEGGVRMNVSVGLQYLKAWLGGNGAAGINNLMEDVATAEISRAQLWQWLYHGTTLSDGGTFDLPMYEAIRNEEVAKLEASAGIGSYNDAVAILDAMVLAKEFVEFLTLSAMEYLKD